MVFYKIQGQEMLFQLVNVDVKEDFALWDNINKRFIRQLDGVHDINDIKFMKQELFQQKYPNLRKSTQYIRDIVILNENKEQYQFGFKKTADDQIRLAINNAISFHQDIREYEITLRKTGQDKETVYNIIVGQRVGLPIITLPEYPPKPIITPALKDNPKAVFSVPKQLANIQPVIALTDKEQVVYGLACEYNGILSSDEFVLGFKHTYNKIWNEEMSSSRVLEIYQNFYKK